MTLRRTYRLMVLVIVALVCVHAGIHRSEAADLTKIAGFTPLSDEPGIAVYRKNRDYLIRITPADGGVLKPLVGEVALSGGLIMHERKNAPAWWASIKSDASAVAAFNGQYFDAGDSDIAPLAFSVKTDGTVTRGYADTIEYQGKKGVLFLGEDSSRVIPYEDNADQLAMASEKNAVVGLLWWADKQPRRRIGRTMIGVSPRGEIYVFISPAATQRYAMAILRRFGISQSEMLMLDGGGSSQLSLRSGQVVPVKTKKQYLRTLPQVMVVQSAR